MAGRDGKTGRGGKRRRPWAVVGAVAALATAGAGWWLTGQVSDFLRRPLSDQDSLASVTSMFIGAAALLVALASLVVAALQLRPRRSPEAGASGGSAQIGTVRDNGRLFQVSNGNVHVHEAPGSGEVRREDPS